MKLKTYKAVWGMPGTWETQLRQIAEAGCMPVSKMSLLSEVPNKHMIRIDHETPLDYVVQSLSDEPKVV